MTRDTFDMPGDCLLGPALETQTPSGFQAYVMGFRGLSTWRKKATKPPKPKREPLPCHNIVAGLCTLCGAKAKSTKAKCKRKIDPKPTVDTEVPYAS